MYRTHTCGELRLKDVSQNVILSGWVQKIRNHGSHDILSICVTDMALLSWLLKNQHQKENGERALDNSLCDLEGFK